MGLKAHNYDLEGGDPYSRVNTIDQFFLRGAKWHNHFVKISIAFSLLSVQG
jgi:hypothetical protein